jgi:hypothetical protein
MKALLKIVGGIVVLLILVLVVLSITGFPPKDGRPGLWIKGDLVTAPVTDWSFTDKFETVQIQTNSWYLIPHSVTIYCVTYQGQLYLTSLVVPGAPPYPGGRQWNANLARDSHVRIKIGDQLYDRTVSYVTDPAERTGVMESETKKYPKSKYPAGSTFNIFHVLNN